MRFFLTEAQIFSPDISRYKKVIFIGDSRTQHLENLLKNMHIDFEAKNVAFVHKFGSGLNWLKEEGFSLLTQKIDEINNINSEDKRPIALVFNSGVNDLCNDPVKTARLYIDFYRSISPELKEKGCDLFLMSVNPIGSVQYNTLRTVQREEWRIRTFNTNLCAAMQGTYTWLDTYNWLLRTGYGTDSNYGSGVDDGLHYTSKTYKRILRKALGLLAGES